MGDAAVEPAHKEAKEPAAKEPAKEAAPKVSMTKEPVEREPSAEPPGSPSTTKKKESSKPAKKKAVTPKGPPVVQVGGVKFDFGQFTLGGLQTTIENVIKILAEIAPKVDELALKSVENHRVLTEQNNLLTSFVVQINEFEEANVKNTKNMEMLQALVESTVGSVAPHHTVDIVNRGLAEECKEQLDALQAEFKTVQGEVATHKATLASHTSALTELTQLCNNDKTKVQKNTSMITELNQKLEEHKSMLANTKKSLEHHAQFMKAQSVQQSEFANVIKRVDSLVLSSEQATKALSLLGSYEFENAPEQEQQPGAEGTGSGPVKKDVKKDAASLEPMSAADSFIRNVKNITARQDADRETVIQALTSVVDCNKRVDELTGQVVTLEELAGRARLMAEDRALKRQNTDGGGGGGVGGATSTTNTTTQVVAIHPEQMREMRSLVDGYEERIAAMEEKVYQAVTDKVDKAFVEQMVRDLTLNLDDQVAILGASSELKGSLEKLDHFFANKADRREVQELRKLLDDLTLGRSGPEAVQRQFSGTLTSAVPHLGALARVQKLWLNERCMACGSEVAEPLPATGTCPHPAPTQRPVSPPRAQTADPTLGRRRHDAIGQDKDDRLAATSAGVLMQRQAGGATEEPLPALPWPPVPGSATKSASGKAGASKRIMQGSRVQGVPVPDMLELQGQGQGQGPGKEGKHRDQEGGAPTRERRGSKSEAANAGFTTGRDRVVYAGVVRPNSQQGSVAPLTGRSGTDVARVPVTGGMTTSSVVLAKH